MLSPRDRRAEEIELEDLPTEMSTPSACRLDAITRHVLKAKGKEQDDIPAFRMLRDALANTGYLDTKLSAEDLENVARQIHIGSGMVKQQYPCQCGLPGINCCTLQVHSDIRVPDSFEMNSSANTRRRNAIKVSSASCAPNPENPCEIPGLARGTADYHAILVIGELGKTFQDPAAPGRAG